MLKGEGAAATTAPKCTKVHFGFEMSVGQAGVLSTTSDPKCPCTTQLNNFGSEMSNPLDNFGSEMSVREACVLGVRQRVQGAHARC